MSYKNVTKQIKGLTLLELIVVVSIIAFTLPALFAIFFILTRQQIKIRQLQALKETSDTAYRQILNTVRNNAIEINSDDCLGTSLATLTNGAPRIFFTDPNSSDPEENCFVYYVNAENQLASMSGQLTSPVILIGETSDNLDLKIQNNPLPMFTKESDRLAKFKFTVIETPKTENITVQELEYQFYIFLPEH